MVTDRVVELSLWRANSLSELGALAVEAELVSGLSQSVRRLWERDDVPEEGRRLGRALLARYGQVALGDLLLDREALRRVKHESNSADRRVLLKAVRHVLETPDAAGPSASEANDAGGADLTPPRDLARLRLWAAQYGLAGALHTGVVPLLPHLPEHLRRTALSFGWGATVEKILAKLGHAQSLSQLQEWLREWLAAKAAETQAGLAAERESQALGDPSFEWPSLSRLWEALSLLRGKLRQKAAPTGKDVLEKSRLSYTPDPPTFLYVDARPQAGGPHQTPFDARVTLALTADGGDAAAPTLECSCRDAGAQPCPHGLAAVDAVRLLLRNAEPSFLRGLAEDLKRPEWLRRLRLLRRLAPPVADEAPCGARLVWRLRPRADSQWRLNPVVQRPTKNGRYSAGRKASPREILEERGAAWSQADRRAAFVLHREHDRYDRQQHITEALQALAGQPNVVLEGSPDIPLTVVEADLGLLCRDRGAEGFELVPAVQGSEVPLALIDEHLDEAEVGEPLLHVDAALRTCFLAHVSPLLAGAIETLGETRAFPPEAADALVQELEGSGLPVVFPARLAGEEAAPNCEPGVFVTPLDDSSFTLELRVRPLADSPPLPIGEGPQIIRGRRGEARVFVRRDFAREQEQQRTLVEALGPEATPGAPPVLGTAAIEVFARLEQLQRERGLQVAWPPRRPVVLRPLRLSDLELRVREGRDWFGLAGLAQIDGKRLELAALLEAARAKRRYVQIDPDTWAELKDDVQRQIAPLADATFCGKHGIELSVAAAPALEILAPELASFDASPSFAELAERLRRAAGFEPSLPRGLLASLRPYQAEGFRWLARLSEWAAGGCLADDMGLGKTVEALALLLHRQALGPALVVAPTSVCFNWEHEAGRFAPSLRVQSYYRCNRDAVFESLGPGDVLVTSYGLLVRDAERFASHAFATLVVDEAQAVKNSATLRARAVRDLQADFRVVLTGTPLENHLGELWAVFRAAFPGLLGSLEQFRERFWVPIERNRDLDRRRSLAQLLKPFILRRTKAEVARELPPRTEVVVHVSLSAEERRLYEDARLAALAQLSGAEPGAPERRRFQVLAALTRLRLLACHPGLGGEAFSGHSAKLARFLELVETLRDEGHRTLVFSQFVRHLELARAALDERGITYQYLDGATPETQRRSRVAAFQGGEGDVFLVSLKAGGTGLNLTGADNVIHLDPWWNPAVEDQATDRAHRIGQRRPVTVYRLVTRGTVEEQILALHADKRALVAGVLDGTGDAARITPEELLSLLQEGSGGGELADTPAEELSADV